MCTNGGWLAGEKPRSQKRDLGHPLVGLRRGLRTGDHQRRDAQTPTDHALLVWTRITKGLRGTPYQVPSCGPPVYHGAFGHEASRSCFRGDE
jgi:hypothetical protein